MITETQSVFVMTAVSNQELKQTQLLVKSLRAFGGVMQSCPVWIFVPGDDATARRYFDDLHIQILPLEIPESVKDYWFARKVCACTQAECKASPVIKSLIWVSYDCLIIQPPELLQLDIEMDAAFRPVHETNIGLPVSISPDDYWKGIYQVVNLEEHHIIVETFVDRKQIHAYFNSHIFSWNPAIGLGQQWFDVFAALVSNRDFQLKCCGDIKHQVFLHQAVLSALIEKNITAERLRILPPVYSYPYNLHASVSWDRRAQVLNDLVCIAYEDRSLHPLKVHDIDIREPLKSWLANYVA
jgi:hypothetical protein